jgi:hypothetical protein
VRDYARWNAGNAKKGEGGRLLHRQCGATKANGERCKGTATGQHGRCWAHAPENAQQRSRTASRGGKGKPSREIRDLKGQLQDLVDGVLSGEVERGDAAVASQLLNVKLRALEQERRWREQEELAERIEKLEDLITGQTRGAGRPSNLWP